MAKSRKGKKVAKRLQPCNQKGCIYRNNSEIKNDLSISEREVLTLYTVDRLTAKQISIVRNTTTQSVYKVLGRLRKNGHLNHANKEVAKSRPTLQPDTCFEGYRLHAQEFNIQILHIGDQYKKKIKKCNTITTDGNTVRLYKKSIEVYSGRFFYGETPQAATAKSAGYWDMFFARLENDLQIVICKDRYQNIRQVNAHYAEIHNEIATECGNKAEYLKITATDDGKLWFLIDNSFNLHEAETTHPHTSKRDMENVSRHLNDIRDNNPPTLTQMLETLDLMAQMQKKNTECLNALFNSVQVLANTVNTILPKPTAPAPKTQSGDISYIQ